MGIGIWVTNLRRTDMAANPDYADIAWNLTYTGLEPTITETVDILHEGTTNWIPRFSRTVDRSTLGDSTTLDLSGIATGTWHIRVTASAADAGEDSQSFDIYIEKAEKTPKIKII
jgi:hypothetical protein